ncbi:MAG: hypothetical protein IPK76_19475 [Lewinellaceae bacterium]|nr:hypothetical protein [Lewinellaceae bacterium]
MKRLLFFCILFLLLEGPARVSAQPETALLHFDKSFYVAGEVAWFQLYLPAHLQERSFAPHLTVVDPAGKTVWETFLDTKGKVNCSGYYEIPYELDAGFYQFHFTARDAERRSTELINAVVPVYSDLKPLPGDVAVPDTSYFYDGSEPAAKLLRVDIRPDGNAPVSPRQPVSLHITVTDRDGKPVEAVGSVSVRDERLTGRAVLYKSAIFTGDELPGNARWLPDAGWAGTALLPDGKPLQTPLLAALDVETNEVHFAETDANGHFLLRVPPYSGMRRIQILERSGTRIRVDWEKDTTRFVRTRLPYTPGILEYLEQSRKRKKIYQLYAAVETKLQRAVSVLPVTEWETRRSYPVQDYERFPDLATFFQEVVWMVKFSSHKGAYKAGMYNTAQLEEFGHAPLFLLDNKATFDADFIARLKPADIDTIDLLYEPKLLRKHFPAIGSGGVIRIKTLRRNGVLPSEQEANIFPAARIYAGGAIPGDRSGRVRTRTAPCALLESGAPDRRAGQGDDHVQPPGRPGRFHCGNSGTGTRRGKGD